jgi:hypothetical protein
VLHRFIRQDNYKQTFTFLNHLIVMRHKYRHLILELLNAHHDNFVQADTFPTRGIDTKPVHIHQTVATCVGDIYLFNSTLQCVSACSYVIYLGTSYFFTTYTLRQHILFLRDHVLF